jgi:3-oxoacyl-[acyl-carrier-protein] synthase-3
VGKPFVINRHGRLVFPSNFLADLDFSVIETEEQLSAVVRRDFEAKAPTGTDILAKTGSGGYASRYELLRDLALNLFWTNRYAMTMYEKRPMRWRDVPRHRDDVYLPILIPWREGERKVAAVAECYAGLPAAWDGEVEDRIHDVLFDVYRHKLHHATELSAIKLTVEEALVEGDSLTYCLSSYDPDFPVYGYEEILDCSEVQPELEALMRMAMVMHNQYPWTRAEMRLEEVGRIADDEFVVVFAPRNREVSEFIRRRRMAPAPLTARSRPGPAQAPEPAEAVPPVIVAERFAVKPHLEALAVAKGERICENEDLIRNTAYSWSPMTADDIREKTGIESRIYTERDLEELALMAATSALAGAGRRAEEIGAVIFCSCTSTRLIPSVATWLSGQLGIFQTHVSFDLVAACAGFPYGIGEAVRLLQDIKRPVLVVCAEKFSDKIGSVRPSRMIFGDGAAAMVVAPAPGDEPGDVDVFQTYASGPASQVNSIIWPNPEFDNNVTVWGPEVKALVERYLVQMMGELRGLPHPEDPGRALVDAIDLVVPHQANRTMVVDLAGQAGIPEESLYFNVDRVGNVSSASIPIAIHDAVTDGVIDRRMRIFAPGFGAGAVAGYAVLWIDPEIIVPESTVAFASEGDGARATTVDDVREAFG